MTSPQAPKDSAEEANFNAVALEITGRHTETIGYRDRGKAFAESGLTSSHGVDGHFETLTLSSGPGC